MSGAEAGVKKAPMGGEKTRETGRGEGRWQSPCLESQQLQVFLFSFFIIFRDLFGGATSGSFLENGTFCSYTTCGKHSQSMRSTFHLKKYQFSKSKHYTIRT